jgi:fluoride exporter
MDKLTQVVALSIGGVIGVNARHWLGVWVNRWASSTFPWPTLLINVSGSFAIGFVSMLLARWFPHPNYRLFAVTGILGGYTTYSSFAFESFVLWERGDRGLSVGYTAATVAAGFVAVVLGVALARTLTIPRADGVAQTESSKRAELGASPGLSVHDAE